MEGTPLLDVLRGLILEPEAQADFGADPSGYMQRHGYDDVDAEHMSEAVGLVADTLPPDVAQAVTTVTEDEAAGDGDALGLLGRLTELDVDPSLADPATGGDGDGDEAALDPGDMEGPVDLDPFDDDVGAAAGEEHDALDLGGGEPGDASFGDDLDDDDLDDDDLDDDDLDDDDLDLEPARPDAGGESAASSQGESAGGFGEGSTPAAGDAGDAPADEGPGLDDGDGGFDLGLDDGLGTVPGFEPAGDAYETGGYDDPAGTDLDDLGQAGDTGDAGDEGPDAFGSGDDIGLF